jgi:ABC-type xylose transport system permease subunit
VLILGYLHDGLGFVGVRNDWALVVTGIVLVLAVFPNEFFRKESR